MASSSFVKHFADGTITLADGTATTPIDVTARFTNGDFSITGLKQTLKDTVAYQTRGTLNTVRYTQRTFPQITFTAQMSEFTSASDDNIADAVLQNGAFASAVSTLGASAEVYTLLVTLTVEGTDFGDSADSTVSFDDVECTIDFSEGEPNTWTLTGTVYGTISGDLAIAGS